MTTTPESPHHHSTRLHQWSAEASDRMAREQVTGGWLRALPTAGVQMLGAVASRGRAVTRQELGHVLPVEPVNGDRWAAPCWYLDNSAEAATLDRYAAQYELAPVRTCAELLDLLARAGVLWVDGDDVGPVAPVPGVDEVFPVTATERAVIAGLRTMTAS
ncbi:DUF6042 family protein [Streptomyces sp. NPDC059063]|uniref:DUF6042 family protein n=1 Tax=Streptomyces sp. NPDC059063 TaxID=3346712 RepID=UPI0036C7D35A